MNYYSKGCSKGRTTTNTLKKNILLGIGDFIYCFSDRIIEDSKKFLHYGRAIKRGGRGKGRAIKEKILKDFKKVPIAIKLEGEGGGRKSLMAISGGILFLHLP